MGILKSAWKLERREIEKMHPSKQCLEVRTLVKSKAEREKENLEEQQGKEHLENEA